MALHRRHGNALILMSLKGHLKEYSADETACLKIKGKALEEAMERKCGNSATNKSACVSTIGRKGRELTTCTSKDKDAFNGSVPGK